MILTRHFDLDIYPGGSPLIIRASRHDASSMLVFSLFAGEGALDIPSGASAVFRGKTGDAAGLLSFDGKTPKVTVILTKTLTSERGIIPFEIVLKTGEYTLVTATLYLDVR